MSQKDELSKVKLRIKALTARTISNGCTEAEAMAAATMVGNLLDQYGLSMGEVEIREEICVQVMVPFPGGSKRRGPVDGCVVAIARFCDVRVWFSSKRLADGTIGGQYGLFGFSADVDMARYLYEIARSTLVTETLSFKSAARRGPEAAAFVSTGARQAVRSFQKGMTHRISDRLDAMLAARVSNLATLTANTGTGGKALVILKQKIVSDAFKKTGIRLTSAKSSPIPTRDHSAFLAGIKAGDRVALERQADALLTIS